MFRSIGTILLLFAIVHLFGAAVQSFERAAVATFNTLEAAAVISQEQIEQQR